MASQYKKTTGFKQEGRENNLEDFTLEKNSS